MNEQAWKEQAARIIREHHRTLVRQPSRTNQPRKTFHNGEYEAAAALYPLVQQAIAAEGGGPVAWMYCDGIGPIESQRVQISRARWSVFDHTWTETPLYTTPPTEAQIRADERERCAKWLRDDAALTEREAVKITANTTGNPREIFAEWQMLVGLKRGLADTIERGDYLRSLKESGNGAG